MAENEDKPKIEEIKKSLDLDTPVDRFNNPFKDTEGKEPQTDGESGKDKTNE